MSLLAKATVPFAISVMIAVSAPAQLLPTWSTNIVLNKKDLRLIHRAMTNQIHGKPVGTIAAWSNPLSGNSGSIKLVKKLTRQNQQCEELDYRVSSGGIPPAYSENYHLTSCLQRDGTWKIV